MKDERYTRLICEKACSFYKPGKEDLLCEGYRYLVRRYSPEELTRLTENGAVTFPVVQEFATLRDRRIETALCEHCAFMADGCDFADDGSGPPCGGYLLALQLMKREIPG